MVVLVIKHSFYQQRLRLNPIIDETSVINVFIGLVHMKVSLTLAAQTVLDTRLTIFLPNDHSLIRLNK